MNVLRSSVDTLEHSFIGDVEEPWQTELDRLKSMAQDLEMPQPVVIAGVELFVQPQSVRRFRWLLRNKDHVIMLRRSGAGPTMMIKLSAFGLASRGVAALWDEARAIGYTFGVTPLNVTRLDLAVDFQGWAPTFEEMRNVRCRSTYRPVLPNTEHPETFYFGKGSHLLRVYNKSVEIEAHEKLWWRTVWRASGHFERGVDVWRIEVELHSEVLKELGCRSVSVVQDRQASLFSWGLEQTSLGAPNGDSNRARWPEDERWREVRVSFGEPEPLSRVRAMSQLIEYNRAVQRHVGVMTSLGASLGDSDFTSVARMLYDGSEGYIAGKNTTFAEMVEKKRRRCSGEGD